MAAYRKAQATYFATWGVTARDRAAADKAAQALRARARRRAADRPVDKILGVPHFTQIKTYYCGPASGLMILTYLKEGRSAYNKDALDQRRIANAAHMRTDINGKTGWSTGLFRIGLNRWRSGSDKHFYIDKSKPTPKFFRTALIADIGLGMPFGADTVETNSIKHYNYHPRTGRPIGHWIVAIGYLKDGAQTRFADPASGMWPLVQPKFTVATKVFVNRYLQSNGITW